MPRHITVKERGVIGERLVELRNKRGKSQQQIAEEIGLKRRTLGYYEEGKANPPRETLIKFAEHYKVSTDYLLGMGS
jgi:transcriptional regulator with XRE-family HTH domain